jgi:hypothetical protein
MIPTPDTACHPLNPNEVQVLWQIKMGIQPYHGNKLEVARLQALECVIADDLLEELDITGKGRETLHHHRRKLVA